MEDKINAFVNVVNNKRGAADEDNMAQINQKEYLKKYLSSDADVKKKKKKKPLSTNKLVLTPHFKRFGDALNYRLCP